jgi:hypothetical protein
MAAKVPSTAGEAGASDDGVVRAVGLLKEALDLLDQADAPPIIGAHVKTAIDAAEEHGSNSPSDVPLS